MTMCLYMLAHSQTFDTHSYTPNQNNLVEAAVLHARGGFLHDDIHILHACTRNKEKVLFIYHQQFTTELNTTVSHMQQ